MTSGVTRPRCYNGRGVGAPDDPLAEGMEEDPLRWGRMPRALMVMQIKYYFRIVKSKLLQARKFMGGAGGPGKGEIKASYGKKNYNRNVGAHPCVRL